MERRTHTAPAASAAVLKTPDQYLADCRAVLEPRRPASPEVAAWNALDWPQRNFILRGLGIDPEHMTIHLMTAHERQRLRKAIEGWAGTALRLQQIMRDVDSAALAAHRALVS